MKSISKILLRTLLVLHPTITSYSLASEHSGESIFVKNCMVCHGDDGAGSLPGTPDLNKDRTWKKRTDTELLKQLTRGIEARNGFTGMPAKGGNPNLTTEQLQAALLHLRSITRD